jgi:hypothetical protein
MSFGVEDLLGIVIALVEFGIVFLLLQSSFRKFLILLVYVIVDSASTLAQTFVDILYGSSIQTTAAKASEGQKLYVHLYWTDEVVLDLLLFLMVIVFTYRALDEGPLRVTAGKLLGGIVLVVCLLPFVLFHPTFTPWPKSRWFDSTSQMLNFGGAVMNLTLWTALIASKRRDPQLLTVSAGLGIVVTGAAISFGLRHLIPPGGWLRWIPNVFLMLTHLGGLVAWCWAFRPTVKRHAATSDAVPSL